MEKTLLIILVGKRDEKVGDIQRLLTDYGCNIKTRLGIHDGTLHECSNKGLIILELVGEKEKHLELQKKIQEHEDVETKLVSLSV